jgi:hypothetical protein
MAKLGGSAHSQKQENQNTVKTMALGKVMGDQGPEYKMAGPGMSLPSLLHQGPEKKHPNEAHRSAKSLINS